MRRGAPPPRGRARARARPGATRRARAAHRPLRPPVLSRRGRGRAHAAAGGGAMKTSKRRKITTTERLAAISVVMVLWIGGLGARLVHLQVYEHNWLEERAIRQQERTVEVSPTRGR